MATDENVFASPMTKASDKLAALIGDDPEGFMDATADEEREASSDEQIEEAAAKVAETELADGTADEVVPDEVEEAVPAEAEDAADTEEEPEEPDETDLPDLLVRKGDELGMEIDGEFLTLPSLRDGYFRQADYTRKTQELADRRRDTDRRAAELADERQQYADRLALVEQILEATAPQRSEREWAELKARDPARYADERDQWLEAERNLQQVRSEQERVSQAQSQSVEQARLQAWENCERELRARVPGWSDEQTMTREAQDVAEYVTTTYRATPEERANMFDWRFWDMARKAMLFDKGEAPKPAQAPKPANDRPVLKPGRPTTKKERQRKKTAGLDAARQRLKESGHVDDASTLIERLANEGLSR